VVWSWLPFLGSALDFGSDALKLLEAQRRKHGDVFVIVVAGNRMVFVCDEKAAAKIASSRDLKFSPFVMDVLVKAFGFPRAHAPLYFEKVDSATHKQMAEFLLNASALEALTAETSARIDAVVARLVREARREWSLYDLVKQVTFEAMVGAIFGETVLGDDPKTLLRIVDDFDEAFPLLVAGAPSRSGTRALGVLTSRFLIEDYEKDAGDFIKARARVFREGLPTRHSGATLQASLLWGSVANLMAAAFWTLFYVLKQPSFVDKVRAECCNGEPDAWVFLDRVITEAFRLSSGSMVMRHAERPTTVTTAQTKQAFKIRAGDRVAVFPPLAHLDPAKFPDPRTFDPDRHVNNADGKNSGVLAFGAGASMCPGRKLARREIKMVIAQLLTHFHIDLVDPSATPPLVLSRVGLGIYPPAVPVLVNLTPRTQQ